MDYEDDEEMQEGPVVVKRTVYDAGMKLQGAVKAGDMPAFETARSKAVKYREAGDAGNAAFWEDIFNFLMWRESVGAGTETIILEEGEAWDAENEKVIRPRAHPPRSGRGNR